MRLACGGSLKSASLTGLRRDRPRVLLIAEAANPEWMSVPLEGWSHASALRDVVDAHVVTQIRNRDAILRAGWREGSDFTAINSEALARPLQTAAKVLRFGTQKGWTTATALALPSYYYFERLVWRQLGRRIIAGEFDVVHRITPLSPTIPSMIAAKCANAGVPFVWGPVNGGVPWPKGFDAVRRKEREWLSYIRGVHRMMPGYHATRRHASAIIVGSLDTLRQVPSAYRNKCVYIPENGIDPARFSTKVDRRVVAPLRVAFVGRLVPYKGADMLIEAAAALVRDDKLVIDIVGDGPEMPRLQALVTKEKIGGGVRLDGAVEHRNLQRRLVQSDVFGFPAVREFGGAVVIEAMALGLVPVVVNYAGPGELVTEDTGFRIPMGSRQDIIRRLREILGDLAGCTDRIRGMGDRARQRVFEHFTWDVKAQQVATVYDWALHRCEQKPVFDMLPADQRARFEEAIG